MQLSALLPSLGSYKRCALSRKPKRDQSKIWGKKKNANEFQVTQTQPSISQVFFLTCKIHDQATEHLVLVVMGVPNWEERKINVLEDSAINQAFQICKNNSIFTFPDQITSVSKKCWIMVIQN